MDSHHGQDGGESQSTRAAFESAIPIILVDIWEDGRKFGGA